MTRGFTIIEVVITLGLLSIAGALTMLIGIDSIARSVVIRERDTVVTFLETARTKALANVNQASHGLHIDEDSFTLFNGNVFNSGDPTNRSYAREEAVSVSGPTDIVFDQLSGSVSAGAGTLVFADSTQSASIEVNEEGRIEW